VRPSDYVDDLVIAATVDKPTLERIETALSEDTGVSPRLLTSADETIDLPEPLALLLRDAARHLAEGQDVRLLATDAELTTQQAADLLNVSRPYLVRLLDKGELPYHRVGTHRRVRVADLLVYKRQRDEQRREALSELTHLSQELGLYDDPRQ
jgi:excisionase family DNA binding protein